MGLFLWTASCRYDGRGVSAGGGKGALIGAALGAGAGTAGSAYTGEKEIVLPAESALSFTLTEPVTVKK
jgi:hypothetical protein